VSHGATLLWAATTTPTPADPDSVTPGLWGFLVVFVLAVVVWLLMRNMTGRLRRLRFREEERLRRERSAGGDGAPGPDEPPPSRPGDHR
jgi:hypothetical protein